MSYEEEEHGDRGLVRGEIDYDEFDELAGLDVDYLQEIGAVMAPATTSPTTSTFSSRLMTSRIAYTPTKLAPVAPTTTSKCPTDERYDEIEQMCVPVQTSTGTSITRLRTALMTAAPTMQVMAPVAVVKPRDTPIISSHGTTPPDSVRAADVLTKAPAPPRLPSYSSAFKGGKVAKAPAWTPSAPRAPIQMLEMPAPPPSATGGKVVGLSTGAKIGLGLGAGALLLYIMTRK